MSAREVALQVVRDVFPAHGGTPRGAQEALDYRLARADLDARDRAFATMLAFGAIKMRRTLDWYLGPYVGARTAPLPPSIAETLRLSVYELRFAGAQPHAAVSQWVGVAKKFGHRGTAGLVNAVLRAFLRDEAREPAATDFSDPDEYLGTRHSFPTWLVKRLRETFGDERLESILEGCNAPAQSAVAVNRARSTRDEIVQWFQTHGGSSQPSSLAEDAVLVADGALARRCERELAGACWVQSETSAMVVDVLNPQPGETVVDACSGRGSKALQSGARLHGDGSVICIERDARKAAALEGRATQAGIPLATIVGDATAPLLQSGADRLLVDAPCSGIGVIGRHPEARWRKQPGDGERLALVQRALLEALAPSVYAGGSIVYAVCSTDRRETSDVAAWFTRAHNVETGIVPARFGDLQDEHGAVLVPPGLHGRDGFYVARFERRG